jgi:hypothetical protein
MSWTDIANKGVDSWWIVRNNQPSGNGSFCNAVPDVGDWNTLSDGKSSAYGFPLKRTLKVLPGLFDLEVPQIDIEFKLRWEYGNQYRRRGMFLRTIWTEVITCNVVDGFDVSIAFRCSTPWNDNPNGNPPWPASMINVAMDAEIATPKWQKQQSMGTFQLMYNGNLVVV